MKSMIDSNKLLNEPQALKARLAEKGYLLFRNILPIDQLLELRKEIIHILINKKWIHPQDGSLPPSACRTPMQEGEDKQGFFEVYDEVMKLERLYSLPHHSSVLHTMKNILGDSAFPHPLSITRLIFPRNNETTTPPHQDYPNNQGTKNLTAAWIPLMDCPQSLGGVAILEGSNQFEEVLPLDFHLGAGHRTAILSEKYQKLDWVATDFQLGDFLVFPALTVHKALNNTSSSTMRLSVDFRFQLEGEALTANVLKPHFNRLDWPDIYANWQDSNHQYYWKQKSYKMVDWDTSYHHVENFNQQAAVNQLQTYRKDREERTKEWKTSI